LSVKNWGMKREKCVQKKEGTVGRDELCAIEKKDVGEMWRWEENKGDGET